MRPCDFRRQAKDGDERTAQPRPSGPAADQVFAQPAQAEREVKRHITGYARKTQPVGQRIEVGLLRAWRIRDHDQDRVSGFCAASAQNKRTCCILYVYQRKLVAAVARHPEAAVVQGGDDIAHHPAITGAIQMPEPHDGPLHRCGAARLYHLLALIFGLAVAIP